VDKIGREETASVVAATRDGQTRCSTRNDVRSVVVLETGHDGEPVATFCDPKPPLPCAAPDLFNV